MANGIRTKLKKFANFLSEKNIDVALICETLSRPDITLNIPGYHFIRIDNERPIGGVAKGVRRSLNARELKLPKTANLELVVIELLGTDANLNFIAAYNSPSKTLLAIARRFSNTMTTIGGDFNAKEMTWGCRKSNPSGKNLLKNFLN